MGLSYGVAAMTTPAPTRLPLTLGALGNRRFRWLLLGLVLVPTGLQYLQVTFTSALGLLAPAGFIDNNLIGLQFFSQKNRIAFAWIWNNLANRWEPLATPSRWIMCRSAERPGVRCRATRS